MITLSVTFISELCHIWYWEHFDGSVPPKMLKLFMVLFWGVFLFCLVFTVLSREIAAQHRQHRVLDIAMMPDLQINQPKRNGNHNFEKLDAGVINH